MTPPAIVETALAEGLAMIAVCDHNSARNVAAVQEAAGERLAVLAGMEITTAEECHVVGLFPDAAAAQAAGAEVGATLGQCGRRLRDLLRRAARARRRRRRERPRDPRAGDGDAARRRRRRRAGPPRTAASPWPPTSTAAASASSASSASSPPTPASTPWSSRATCRGLRARGRVRRARPADPALVRRPLPARRRRGPHDVCCERPTLRRAGARRPRPRGTERRRCMTSRSTSSTSSRTPCAPARR